MVFSESAPAEFSFFVTPRAPRSLTFKQFVHVVPFLFSVSDLAIRHQPSRRSAGFCCQSPASGRGCRSWIRDGSLTRFDLSIACADFEAWLWVHGGSVNDMAIFKVKPRSVIRTHNAVIH